MCVTNFSVPSAQASNNRINKTKQNVVSLPRASQHAPAHATTNIPGRCGWWEVAPYTHSIPKTLPYPPRQIACLGPHKTRVFHHLAYFADKNNGTINRAVSIKSEQKNFSRTVHTSSLFEKKNTNKKFQEVSTLSCVFNMRNSTKKHITYQKKRKKTNRKTLKNTQLLFFYFCH